MTTVTLTDEQLELLRRKAMQQAATDMRHLADALEHLAIVAPWEPHADFQDLHPARSIVDESLGTLDALGWPEGTA